MPGPTSRRSTSATTSRGRRAHRRRAAWPASYHEAGHCRWTVPFNADLVADGGHERGRGRQHISGASTKARTAPRPGTAWRTSAWRRPSSATAPARLAYFLRCAQRAVPTLDHAGRQLAAAGVAALPARAHRHRGRRMFVALTRHRGCLHWPVRWTSAVTAATSRPPTPSACGTAVMRHGLMLRSHQAAGRRPDRRRSREAGRSAPTPSMTTRP